MNKNNLEDSQNMNIFHDENSDDIEADLGMAGENFMQDLPVDDIEDDNDDQYDDHDDFENVDEDIDDYGNPIMKKKNPYQSNMSGGQMKGSIQIQGSEHIYNDYDSVVQNKKDAIKIKKPKLALDKHEDFGDTQVDGFNPRDSSYIVNDIKTSQKLIDIYGEDNGDAYEAYGNINKQKQKINEGADVISGQNIIDVRDSQQDDERIPPPVVTSSPKEKKGGKINEKEFVGLSICDEAQQSKQVIAQQISQAELQLKPHERKIGQYILGKTIGEGTFGKVKIGMHILTKAKVAVKILEKSKIVDVADVERVSREIHILKIVQHPQVVQLYEIIETQKKLYLIMEYASGGELFDYIVKHQRVKEPEACKFFQQLLSGIEYISRLNIVHRDLKPENLLLDFDKGIKIVDFGLSNTYKTGELLKTACGSPCYAAPEMIAGKKYNGTNVDIWSCGVILFALICGYLPFEDPNTSSLYKKILSADFQTPEWVSDDAKDLFHCILNTDPEKRYTIDQIRQHPWFKLVNCESNFKGIKVGIDPVPIDNTILDTMQNQYGIDKHYARKCIQANKHNHISASYYLLLKEIIKKGEKSIADVRQPDYNPQLFVHTALQVRREKMRDKLENASMQSQKFVEEQEDPQPDIMMPSDSNANLAIVEKEKEKVATDKENQRNSAKAPRAPVAERNKSTQPQRLRKIADGLLEFERYADRKKRLQNLEEKQQTLDLINTMNQKLSQSKMQEDMLSNGGLGLLQRGLSPIGCNVTSDQGYDLNDQNMLYNQNFMEGRDYSPSLSPVNMQKGNMSTQYGNFLYQKDAKQFNQNIQPQPQQKSSIDQYQLTALKNQLLMQQQNNQLGQVNVNQMNTKQIHKQLKQLYLQSKKGGQQKTNNNKNANQKIVADNEIILKNLVNQSQMAPGANTNLSQQQNMQSISHTSNISRMQALQKNYQKKTAKPAQNFSTIQTAYDTLQHQNQQNMVLNKSKKGSVHHNKNMSHNLGNDVSQGNAPSSHHNRFATTTYTTNPVFSTIQQPNNYNIQNNSMNNSTTPGYNMSQKTDKFASTHGAFFAQNGSRLGVQSNLQGKGKRNKNSTVSGSGSFIQPSGIKNKGGVFSPKNPPTNSFGFGVAGPGGQFNQTQAHTVITTPQANMTQQQQQMFTIDQPSSGGNFSNQLKASLHQQGVGQNQKRSMMDSLNLQQKQNSQPTVKAQNNGSGAQNPSQSSQSRPRIGANKRGSSIQQRQNLPSMQKQDITSQQSQQSNKALFKRRRDHSKTNKQNKSAQKYSQYGTIQQHDSKSNMTAKPPLNESVVNRSTLNSQKKIKAGKSVGKQNPSGTYRNENLQQTDPNSSMKRIIETSQNLANLNINIGNPMSAISTKNSNLFSPVGGINQATGQALSPQMPLTPNYQHADQLTNNMNRIQNTLNIKKQQRQNQKSGSMATAKNTRNAVRDSLEHKTASQATTTIQNMSSLASPNASRQHDAQAHQLSTFTAVPVHSFQQQLQQYNQFSPQNINNKKIQLNNQLMTQNYAPHLLLQNFHGNGYPPGQQSQHVPVPQSNPINQYMSPQNNHPSNQLQVQVKGAQRRKTPQLNQTQMKQAPITTTKAWCTNKFANAMPPLDNSNIDFSDDVDISNNTIANIQQQLGGGNNSVIIQSPSPTKKGKGSKSQNNQK